MIFEEFWWKRLKHCDAYFEIDFSCSVCKMPVVNMQYEVPSWSQIYDMLIKQAEKIQKANFNPDLIVGVARGGLVPSRVLADLLGVQELAQITIEYYVDIAKTCREPTLKQCLNTSLKGKKVLLVDDVSDCGASLQVATKHLSECDAAEIKIATLYCKPKTKTVPDFYEKKTSRWVVFPWDAAETLRKLSQQTQSKRAVKREIDKLVKAGLSEVLVEKFSTKST